MSIERSCRKRINREPGIRRGIPVITGTRVPLEIIVGGLANGMSVDEVCEGYKLTDADVRATLMYATELLVKERPK